MESIPILLQIVLFLTCLVLLISILRPRRTGNLPPGPPPLPIIGNILQLGRNPHQTLTHLAKTYGPIMYLKLGHLDTIVVSSPDLAKQVLQKHDHLLSSRNPTAVSTMFNHDKISVLWLPTNARWRTLRRICKDHMFSLRRMDSSEPQRQHKLKMFRDYLRECCDSCRILDIADVVFTTSLNILSANLFSMDLADFHSDSSQELKEIVHGLISTLSAPNLADFFPVLKPLDPQGLKRSSTPYVLKLFRTFNGIIDQRLNSASIDSNDLLDALLEISRRDESELSRNDILHFISDLFIAGTDTTTTTVEWAMAELINNPKEMAKARHELHTIIGKDQEVQESDILRLPYLQAVLKETFRLHPAGPLLIPHKADAEIDINGYTIPKNAQVMVNVWALGRDPDIWTDAERFNPERFMDSKMDIKGQDFELIPFSSGRRICPGIPLAHRMVHLMVASMIQGFDWKLEGGMRPEDMNMDDKFESTLQRVVPLKAVPVRI